MRRGFTLIEILVVITVIGLLVGIAFVGAGKLMESGKANATKALVSSVGTLPTDLYAEVKQYPRYTGGYSATPAADRDSIEFLVAEVLGVKKTKDKLAGFGSESLERDASGDPEWIKDSWDRPLRYSNYNANGAGPDDDTYGNLAEGLPIQKRPYVASAGPDQEWGTFTASASGPVPDEAAKDNIYSFDVN